MTSMPPTADVDDAVVVCSVAGGCEFSVDDASVVAEVFEIAATVKSESVDGGCCSLSVPELDAAIIVESICVTASMSATADVADVVDVCSVAEGCEVSVDDADVANVEFETAATVESESVEGDC